MRHRTGRPGEPARFVVGHHRRRDVVQREVVVGLGHISVARDEVSDELFEHRVHERAAVERRDGQDVFGAVDLRESQHVTEEVAHRAARPCLEAARRQHPTDDRPDRVATRARGTSCPMTLPSKRVSELDDARGDHRDTTGDRRLGGEMMPAHLEAARGMALESTEIAVGEGKGRGRVA